MSSVKWVLKNAAKYKLSIAALSVFNFALALISVLYALCFRDIIDSALAESYEKAVKMSVILIGLVLIQAGVSFASNYIQELTKTKLSIKLRRETLDSLMKKEYSSFSAIHTGEIQNRLFSDINVIVSNSIGLLPTLINFSVRLIAAFGVLFFINKYFGLVFLIIGAICAVCMLVFRGKLKSLHKDMQKKEGIVRSNVQETVMGALLIKIFGAAERRLSTLDTAHEEYKKSVMRRRLFSGLANVGMNVAYNAGFLLAFFLCILGIVYGFISFGSLTAVLQLTGQIQGSVSGITGIVPAWYSMTASAERLLELLNLPDERLTAEPPKDLEKIEVKNVSFSYGREDVLKNVSLTVNSGEAAAILGVSGAGKSTLLMLLLGIYTPVSGEIVMSFGNGFRTNAGVGSRKLFSYVPQDNQMFSGTIRENLIMSGDAPDTEIYRALNIACADFISELPQGIDTVIGENGFGLSEGQRQRLAIARAILADTPVILFDEATSALDEATERRLIKNLGDIKKTSILITHRTSVLKICDSAYILEDGEMRKR